MTTGTYKDFSSTINKTYSAKIRIHFGQVKSWLSLNLLLIISINAFSQTTGDYQSSVATGNWNTLATWQRWNGGAWVTPTAGQGYPGQSAIPGTVTIRNGHSITLNVTPANNLGNLVIGGGTSGTLTDTGNPTLTINGNLTINAGGSFTYSSTSNLSIGGTTLVTGTFTDNETTGTNTYTGLVTISGSGTWDTSTVTQEIRMAFNGSLTNSGSFTAGGVQIGSNGIVTANSNMTISSGFDTDDNATITGAGTVSVTGDRSNIGTVSTGNLTVSGNMSITSTNAGVVLDITGNLNLTGGTLTMNTNSTGLTVHGTTTISGSFVDNFDTGGVDTFIGLVTLSGAGSFTTTSVTTGGNLIFEGGIAHSGTSFNAAAATFNTAGQNLSGTSTINFSSTVTVTGITVTNNGIATMSNTAAGTLTGTGTFTQGTGTLNYAGSTITVTNFNATNTGNTVNYNAAGAQTIRNSGTSQYYNLTVSGSNTKTLAAATDIIGNVSIQGTAVFSVSTFNITVEGNWSNASTNADPFTRGTATVTFDGTTAQTISNSGDAQGTEFNNLVLNNTFSTSPQFTVSSGNVIVDGTLTMTAGNVNLNSNTLTLGTGTAAATVGTLSHGGTSANGWMYGGNFTRFFRTTTFAIGSVTGFFPMGSSSDFRPFYVAPTAVPTSGGTITLSHTNATTTNSVTITDDVTVKIRRNAFWTVTPAGGMAGGTYSLMAGGTGFNKIQSVTNLRLILFNGIVGSPTTNGGTTSNPQVNRISVPFANLGNNFYIGSTDPVNTTLPIELVSFTAAREANQVQLAWSTSTEINNDFFTIERSADGINFESLLTVKGAGNSSAMLNYQAVDEHPVNSSSYYRLKQTDFNGGSTYSKIVYLDILPGDTSFNVYPIPSQGDVFLQYISNDESQQIVVSIFDINGNKIYVSPDLFSNTGANTIIDASWNLKPGVYFAKIETGSKSFTKKIILQ